MEKLLVICGPTATSKTALAVRLAKKFEGELISADSRQVYQGMDIGTGKDHPREVAIHLIDVAKPNQVFNVAQYYALARKALKDIWRQEKLPILVGGTGFYIKAILEGIGSLGIGPDQELRGQLAKLNPEQLREKLKQLDPERLEQMNLSDRQNPRRLVRAIEIAMDGSRTRGASKGIKADVLLIGLKAPLKTLYQRIDQRVEKRINQGVEKEIKGLLAKGYSWENSVLGETIAYQEWQPFFEGQATRLEVVQRWKFAEHAYARRQMTWFRKNKQIRWLDITEKSWEQRAEKLVANWLT